ncbi:MAG: hypothetical protein FWD15_02270 [Alphaproteobacteria bacterium]|nr:hypothetical protein [Alphaproteobacteria bacterium]
MKKRKVHITLAAVLTALAMHLFCCIMPLVLALVSFIFGASIALDSHLISHDVQVVVLAISGALLLGSFIYSRVKKHPDPLLPWIAALYAITVALHLLH